MGKISRLAKLGSERYTKYVSDNWEDMLSGAEIPCKVYSIDEEFLVFSFDTAKYQAWINYPLHSGGFVSYTYHDTIENPEDVERMILNDKERLKRTRD